MLDILEREHEAREVGARLREFRDHAGLTQTEAGKIMGVDRRSVSRIEQGHFLPNLAGVIALARRCNVSADWLLTGRGTMGNKTIR